MPIVSIIAEISGKYLSAIFSVEYLIVLYLVYNLLKIQVEILKLVKPTGDGADWNPLRNLIEKFVFQGLLTGLAVSLVLLVLGIVIRMEDYILLLGTAILLSFYNYRFFCFSYAAGILCMISFIFGVPRISIPGILALIAVLHIAEGVLVLLIGDEDSAPVILKTEKGIVGGYFMHKYWPVPLVLVAHAIKPNAIIKYFRGLPHWPLLSAGVSAAGYVFLGLVAASTVLIYTDVAISVSPKEKCRRTGVLTLVYGAILLAVAVLSRDYPVLRLIGGAFATAAHECIYCYEIYLERNRMPLYSAAERGLRVLYVEPGSPAEKMKITGGDIILGINGNDVQTEEGLKAFLDKYPHFIYVRVRDRNGEETEREYRQYPEGINDLGVILVPRENEVTYNLHRINNMGVLGDIIRRFHNRGTFEG